MESRLRLSTPTSLDFQSCCKSQPADAGIRLTPVFPNRSISLRCAIASDRWPEADRFTAFHFTLRKPPETGPS